MNAPQAPVKTAEVALTKYTTTPAVALVDMVEQTAKMIIPILVLHPNTTSLMH